MERKIAAWYLGIQTRLEMVKDVVKGLRFLSNPSQQCLSPVIQGGGGAGYICQEASGQGDI